MRVANVVFDDDHAANYSNAMYTGEYLVAPPASHATVRAGSIALYAGQTSHAAFVVDVGAPGFYVLNFVGTLDRPIESMLTATAQRQGEKAFVSTLRYISIQK